MKPNTRKERKRRRVENQPVTTHRGQPRKDRLVPLCSEEIIMYQRVLYHHIAMRVCKNNISAAVMPNTPEYLTEPPLSSVLDLNELQDLQHDLDLFCLQMIDDLIVMGFSVFTITPRSGKDPTRSERLGMPIMRRYNLQNGERYALRLSHGEARDAIVVQRNGQATFSDIFGNPMMNTAHVTYSAIKDMPCERTGRLRCDIAGVYSTLCFEQSIMHSSMISDRARAQPFVFTRTRTDNAFDERSLVTLNSDRRVMSAMDNMQARNSIFNQIHTRQNEANSDALSDTAKYYNDSLHPSCRITHNPLNTVPRASALLPLPMDADIAIPPMATGRTDLAQLLNKTHDDVMFAMGLRCTKALDTAGKGRANAWELSPAVTHRYRVALKTALVTVWNLAIQEAVASRQQIVLKDVHFEDV
ncbi:hypothetical protein CYMTET_2752 [Cymbomonas tetramitiformis]|uniref:Uncharacterized protein n=1 Tax=Cymbomonas tetramitiformis TaxID=36881 RepID=A0AAE0H6D7_9CHLO|nr:hypothetical protein CYMTET_2752 [Cymbomonas tetramitiformis]